MAKTATKKAPTKKPAAKGVVDNKARAACKQLAELVRALPSLPSEVEEKRQAALKACADL